MVSKFRVIKQVYGLGLLMYVYSPITSDFMAHLVYYLIIYWIFNITSYETTLFVYQLLIKEGGVFKKYKMHTGVLK